MDEGMIARQLTMPGDKIPDSERSMLLGFYARSFGDEVIRGKFTLFDVAAVLFHSGAVGTLIINGNDGEKEKGGKPKQAWPGKDYYLDELQKRHVPQGAILTTSTEAYNCKLESLEFLRIARLLRKQTIVTLTQAHQTKRFFLNLLQMMKQTNTWLRAYAVSPTAEETDWQTPVFGSQGAEKKPRIEHLRDELKRIPIYREDRIASGGEVDLASDAELFDYLLRRESIGR